MSYGCLAEGGKQGRKWLLPPWLFLLPLVLLSVPAAADLAEKVRLDAEQRVLSYVRARGWVNYSYEVSAWVPSSADRLGACSEGLQVAPAQDSNRRWGRIPYLISCAEPAWEFRGRAEVSLRVPVATARRTIQRGEILDRSTVMLQTRDLAGIYGDFVTDTRMLYGKRARRAIRNGQEITLDQAEAPLLVERGDNVVIRVDQDGVRASMRGMALQSGSLGEGILVRNLSSNKEITAWVVEKGIVETRF